jgi:hypothetical protein
VTESAVEPKQNVPKEANSKMSTVRLQARVSPETAARFEKAKASLGAQSNEDVLVKLMDQLEAKPSTAVPTRTVEPQEEVPRLQVLVPPPVAKHGLPKFGSQLKFLRLGIHVSMPVLFCLRKLQCALWKAGYWNSEGDALFYALIHYMTTVAGIVEPEKSRILNELLEKNEISKQAIVGYLHQAELLPTNGRNLQPWERRGLRPTRVKGTPQVKPERLPRETQREEAVQSRMYEPETEPLASENPSDYERMETTFDYALIPKSRGQVAGIS